MGGAQVLFFQEGKYITPQICRQKSGDGTNVGGLLTAKWELDAGLVGIAADNHCGSDGV